MFYYKIINFVKANGQCDYKGLNIKLNYPSSQKYPRDLEKNNMCILANKEDIKSNGDLLQITKEEYSKLNTEIEEENKKNTQPTQQELLNAKLLKDNAKIQIELNKQKELNADLLLKIAQLGGNANA
ncbi:hypothetical protein CF095_18405 [Clostridium botulinum]